MFDVAAANASLLRTYEAAWPSVTDVVNATPGASGAHLVRIPEGFADVPIRVAIVGQQTADTHSDAVAQRSLHEQLARYPEGGVVREKSGTPFWQAACKVADALVGQKDAPLLWTNLVAMDVDGQQPSEGVRDAIRGSVPPHGLLRHILEAAEPDVVVFFTGPNGYYAYEMRHQFPGLELREVEGYEPNALVQVAHPALPAASFRSYHPKPLQMKKILDSTVADIVSAARAALSPPA